MVMSCHSPCGLFALVGRAWIGTIHLSLVISWADVQAWQPCPAAIGGHVTRLPQGRMRISFKNHKQKIVKLYNIKYISRILSKPDFSTQQPCVCVLPLCENREEDFVLMQQFSGWERPKFFLGFFCRATRWAMWAVSLHTAAKHIVYTHTHTADIPDTHVHTRLHHTWIHSFIHSLIHRPEMRFYWDVIVSFTLQTN